MATQLDKIKRNGVEVSFEFDNDAGFSLVDNSRKVFELPLWRPNWAYNFIEAEKEFESVERDEYLDSLCCTLCCNEDCTKFTCCGAGDRCQEARCICCGARRNCSPNDCKKCCQGVTDQVFKSNPFYNLHYVFHAIIRVPMFYVTLCLVFLNAIFFRVSRDAWLWGVNSVEAAQNCRCEKIFNFILIPVANFFYLIPAATAGMLVYTIDIVVNELVFRPLVCSGLSLDIAFRNGAMVEPLVPDDSFRNWVERVYEDWARAADILVNDRGGIEANSKLRDAIIEPKQLLAAFSILPPHVTQVNGAGVAAPFFIQIVIIVIVLEYLYRPINCPDDPTDPCDEDENKTKELTNVRLLAALGAFLYYLNKSAESAAKFATTVRGHTNNVFLLVDLIANVFFPYAVIPLAVQIVLNSEALDIVLNLLALEFVTIIDEELFDESVKDRCNGPYCFVFKIREVPKRRFLKLMKNETETVMVVDVWSKQGILEELDGGVKKETQYWIRDKDFSQFQAKLKPNNDEVFEITRLKELRNTSYTWNHCQRIDLAYHSPASSGRSSDLKHQAIPRKPELMHLYISDLPLGVNRHDLEAAIEKHGILKALGKCRANRPTFQSPLSRNKESEAVSFKGTASVFVEFPERVPCIIARYDNREESVLGLLVKGVEVKVSPLVAVKEDAKDLPRIRNLFGTVLRSNYQKEHGADAEKAHIKLLGEINDDVDSRVLVVYDFPFPDEGGYGLETLTRERDLNQGKLTKRCASKGWLLGSVCTVEQHGERSSEELGKGLRSSIGMLSLHATHSRRMESGRTVRPSRASTIDTKYSVTGASQPLHVYNPHMLEITKEEEEKVAVAGVTWELKEEGRKREREDVKRDEEDVKREEVKDAVQARSIKHVHYEDETLHGEEQQQQEEEEQQQAEELRKEKEEGTPA